MSQQPGGYYPQPVYLTDEQFNAINDSVTVIRQCAYVTAIFVVMSVIVGAFVGIMAMA